MFHSLKINMVTEPCSVDAGDNRDGGKNVWEITGGGKTKNEAWKLK
jgi:hypothetical protein